MVEVCLILKIVRLGSQGPSLTGRTLTNDYRLSSRANNCIDSSAGVTALHCLPFPTIYFKEL